MPVGRRKKAIESERDRSLDVERAGGVGPAGATNDRA
jgi:hypothetical protein